MKCQVANSCPIYDPKSYTCNSEGDAVRYCGKRRDT